MTIPNSQLKISFFNCFNTLNISRTNRKWLINEFNGKTKTSALWRFIALYSQKLAENIDGINNTLNNKERPFKSKYENYPYSINKGSKEIKKSLLPYPTTKPLVLNENPLLLKIKINSWSKLGISEKQLHKLEETNILFK